MKPQHNCESSQYEPDIEINQEDKHLTAREKEAVFWAAMGKAGDVIGIIMGITRRTADAHLDNARAKLNASNKTHLVAKAFAHQVLVIADRSVKAGEQGFIHLGHLIATMMVGIVLGQILVPDDDAVRPRPRNNARTTSTVRIGRTMGGGRTTRRSIRDLLLDILPPPLDGDEIIIEEVEDIEP